MVLGGNMAEYIMVNKKQLFQDFCKLNRLWEYREQDIYYHPVYLDNQKWEEEYNKIINRYKEQEG